MKALVKKQMRKARAAIRKHDIKIEGVIRTSASSPIPVRQHKLDIDRLLVEAQADMGLRIRLSDMARNGNTQAAKRRRQLNDWELNTKPAGPVDAWQEDSKHRPKNGGRRAVGKCDVDAVQSLNKAKRGY
jgi:hypothetical protein